MIIICFLPIMLWDRIHQSSSLSQHFEAKVSTGRKGHQIKLLNKFYNFFTFYFRIDQMVLSLSVKLLKANGQKPAKNAKVAVANNFLNCLFKSSTILLNNTPGGTYQSVRTNSFAIYTLYFKSKYEHLAQTKLTN